MTQLYCSKTGEKTYWLEKIVKSDDGRACVVHACEDCEEKCIVDTVFVKNMTPEGIRDSELVATNFADMVGKMDKMRA